MSPHLQLLVSEVRYPISKSAGSSALDRLADYAHRLEVRESAQADAVARLQFDIDGLDGYIDFLETEALR